MKILLIGENGQLGSTICKRFKIADSLQKTKNPVEKAEDSVVKAPAVKAKAEKTILSEMKSVFVSKESRKVWLKFILNGFNLKD